jgi:hypothetical protein
MRRTLGIVLKVLDSATYLVALGRTVGFLVILVARGTLGHDIYAVLWAWAAFAAVALARRAWRLEALAPRSAGWLGWVAAGAFWLALALHQAGVPEGRFRYLPDLDLRVDVDAARAPSPENPAMTETTARNEFGLRGLPHRALEPGAILVALTGCSFVFGENLPEPEAPHAALEHALRAQGVAAQVYNFGWPGVGPATNGALLAYARSVLPVRLGVAILMGHHMGGGRDSGGAWGSAAPGLAYRVLAASGLEPVYLVLDHHLAARSAGRPRPARSLDAFLERTGGLPLLVVTDFSDANTADLSPDDRENVLRQQAEARAWFDAHPGVAWLDVSLDPAWRGAERDRLGHYWSRQGVTQVASILARAAARALERDAASHPPTPEAVTTP